MVENGSVKGFFGELGGFRDFIDLLGDEIHPFLGAHVERDGMPVLGRIALREGLIFRDSHSAEVRQQIVDTLERDRAGPVPEEFLQDKLLSGSTERGKREKAVSTQQPLVEAQVRLT